MGMDQEGSHKKRLATERITCLSRLSKELGAALCSCVMGFCSPQPTEKRWTSIKCPQIACITHFFITTSQLCAGKSAWLESKHRDDSVATLGLVPALMVLFSWWDLKLGPFRQKMYVGAKGDGCHHWLLNNVLSLEAKQVPRFRTAHKFLLHAQLAATWHLQEDSPFFMGNGARSGVKTLVRRAGPCKEASTKGLDTEARCHPR